MDLIGSVNYIENRLGGRKPNQGKAEQKKSRNNAADEKNPQTDSGHPATEHDGRLGGKIDTIA